jgi:type I restriction enzyme M protein
VDLQVGQEAIKATILVHPEFVAFSQDMARLFEDWRSRSELLLKKLAAGCHPKEVIGKLSEDLLEHYVGKDLVDRYDVYQHLMDYWAEVMQDDCYLIAMDGWTAETYRILEVNKKGKEIDKGWACDLVPKDLIVARYFAEKQGAIESQLAELEAALAQMTELEEEHGGEDGSFGELEKVNGANVKARLKDIKGESAAKDEEKVLKLWLKLFDQSAGLKKVIKEAEEAIDRLAYGQYSDLSEAEIKGLVVNDKWLARIEAEIAGEMERVSQGLAQRVKVLALRYAVALPEVTKQVAELEERVAAHLAKMGFAL